MTSPRKITYERSKSCRSRTFHLYAPTSFAMVHLSNTSTVINTMCRIHDQPYVFLERSSKLSHLSHPLLGSPICLALPHQKTALAGGRVPNAKQLGDPSRGWDSIKETALWLIFRVPQHVDPFNPTASSIRLTWSLRGEMIQDLRSHSVILKDLNYLFIRKVFCDNCNFPLFILYF